MDQARADAGTNGGFAVPAQALAQQASQLAVSEPDMAQIRGRRAVEILGRPSLAHLVLVLLRQTFDAVPEGCHCLLDYICLLHPLGLRPGFVQTFCV